MQKWEHGEFRRLKDLVWHGPDNSVTELRESDVQALSRLGREG
jgi:hypothetical protein